MRFAPYDVLIKTPSNKYQLVTKVFRLPGRNPVQRLSPPVSTLFADEGN